jgi:hypothetical protein
VQLKRVTKQRVIAATPIHGVAAAVRLLVEVEGIAEQRVTIPTAADQVGAAQPVTLQKSGVAEQAVHARTAGQPVVPTAARSLDAPRVAEQLVVAAAPEQPVRPTVTGRQRKAGIHGPDLVAGGERVAKADIGRATTDQQIVMARFRTNAADEFHGARRD